MFCDGDFLSGTETREAHFNITIALKTLRVRTKMLRAESFLSGRETARSAFQQQIALTTPRIRTTIFFISWRSSEAKMCDGNSQFCVRKRKRKGDARSAFQQHIALKMLRVLTKALL